MRLSLFVLLTLCLTARQAAAQLPPEAFDPDCYFPKFGVAGEIDTIYGSVDRQMMGDQFISIGPTKSYPYNRFVISGLPSARTELREVHGGPNFTLDTLRKANRKPGDYVSGEIIKRGPFRRPGQEDAFVWVTGGGPFVYWADSNGDLSDERRTMLVPRKRGLRSTFYEPEFLYAEYLTSDTVMDVILAVSMYDVFSEPARPGCFLMLYKGGEFMYDQGDTVFESQYEFADSVSKWGYTSQADWRGSGHDDLIRITHTVGHGFHYKHSGQFELSEFIKTLKQDTLWSAHDYPMDPREVWTFRRVTSMRAFPKPAWDKSVDFMPFIPFANDLTADLSIFKGGPEFGSKRLKLDSPSYKIRHPYKYGMNVIWGGIMECGDMTGTGNPVIQIGGGPWSSSLVGMGFFYVLGEALDEKIDMFIQEGNRWGGLGDTITADKDGLQDIIIASSSYTSEKDAMQGKRDVGSIQIVHGSKKIPVRINPDLAVARGAARSQATIKLFPVPTNDQLTLEFSNEAHLNRLIQIRDVLGRLLHSTNFAGDRVTLDVSHLQEGTYLVTCTSESETFSEKFTIAR